MRMKFNKSSQLLLLSAASILTAGLLSACSTLTTDFVYVTCSKAAGSNNYGEINVFEINSESGKMRQIPASPVYSEGRNPVAEAVAVDYSNLFVVNQDDNTIVQFIIGSDGKLYPYYTVNTPGINPLAIAVSSSNVFVADLYKPSSACSSASPCSGSVGVFPITAAKGTTPLTISSYAANGSLSYYPLCKTGYTLSSSTYSCKSTESDIIVPTATVVSPNGSYLYVAAYDNTASPNVGYIFAFTVSSSGALTPVTGSPFQAGVKLTSIATDSANKYIYATDKTSNTVYGFTVASGALTALSGSPYATGTAPTAIVVNQAYNFAYVASSTDSTVTGYSISNGILTKVGAYTAGLEPVALGIDPSTNHFLYSANFLAGTVSGWQLSTTDGSLMVSQSSPYSTNPQPTAVAAIPHK